MLLLGCLLIVHIQKRDARVRSRAPRRRRRRINQVISLIEFLVIVQEVLQFEFALRLLYDTGQALLGGRDREVARGGRVQRLLGFILQVSHVPLQGGVGLQADTAEIVGDAEAVYARGAYKRWQALFHPSLQKQWFVDLQFIINVHETVRQFPIFFNVSMERTINFNLEEIWVMKNWNLKDRFSQG